MKKIEKKIAGIYNRYNELKRELNIALTSLAEQGFKLSFEEAESHNFFLSDFRGEDGVWVGMVKCCYELNAFGKAVGDAEPCVILHMLTGNDAHTEKLVPLRYISQEDEFYMANYIAILMKEEAEDKNNNPFSVLTPSYGNITFKKMNDEHIKGIEVYEMTDAKGGFCGEIEVEIGKLTELTANVVEIQITENLFS